MVRAVGFWRRAEADESDLPHPSQLVEPGWAGDDLARVANYLRSGRTYVPYRGYSFCRFACGVEDASMGSRDLGDGVWLWPEGLAHYVECHSVRLPDEFIEAMRSHGWQVPAEEALPGKLERFKAPRDLSFWVEWARGFQKKQGRGR
jgi:hypothetical protein